MDIEGNNVKLSKPEQVEDKRADITKNGEGSLVVRVPGDSVPVHVGEVKEAAGISKPKGKRQRLRGMGKAAAKEAAAKEATAKEAAANGAAANEAAAKETAAKEATANDTAAKAQRC